jgi:hypothetical protein
MDCGDYTNNDGCWPLSASGDCMLDSQIGSFRTTGREMRTVEGARGSSPHCWYCRDHSGLSLSSFSSSDSISKRRLPPLSPSSVGIDILSVLLLVLTSAG